MAEGSMRQVSSKYLPIFSGRFFSIGKLLLLGAILMSVFVFSVIFGMRLAVKGTLVEVPSLVGMSRSDAESVMSRVGLTLVVSGERYDSQVPRGAIISQVPGAGVDLKSNGDVRVILSLGRRINPVPDLRETTVRAARMMAEQNGYELGYVSEVVLPDGDDGRIISQYPAAHSSENIGAKIDVLVSRSEPVAYVMPDLVGQNLNRVLQLFKRYGFEVGRIQYSSVPNAVRGVVLRQFPEPGYQLQRGQEINLEVAR